MTWQKVATLFILVTGAVVVSAMGNKELGLVLAGAAAGFATQNSGAHPGNDRRLPTSDKSDP